MTNLIEPQDETLPSASISLQASNFLKKVMLAKDITLGKKF